MNSYVVVISGVCCKDARTQGRKEDVRTQGRKEDVRTQGRKDASRSGLIFWLAEQALISWIIPWINIGSLFGSTLAHSHLFIAYVLFRAS